MYMPINPLGYSCIKKLQRNNLWHAYNEPINFYSVYSVQIESFLCLGLVAAMTQLLDYYSVVGYVKKSPSGCHCGVSSTIFH